MIMLSASIPGIPRVVLDNNAGMYEEVTHLITVGQDAVNSVRNRRPDMILMALVMPVMTGFDAIKAIRDMPEGDRIPIIAVSANVAESKKVSRIVAGWDAFLLKPIQAKSLFDAFTGLLQIEWIYNTTSPVPPSDILAENQETLLPPSQRDLQEFYNLALRGDMVSIREHAARLKQNDQRFHLFATKVDRLAQAYQGEHIL